jgi:hypothetical protein
MAPAPARSALGDSLGLTKVAQVDQLGERYGKPAKQSDFFTAKSTSGKRRIISSWLSIRSPLQLRSCIVRREIEMPTPKTVGLH